MLIFGLTLVDTLFGWDDFHATHPLYSSDAFLLLFSCENAHQYITDTRFSLSLITTNVYHTLMLA